MSGQLYKLNRRKQRWEFSLKRSAVRFIIPRWCSTCRKGQSIKACGAEFIRSCAIKKLISTHEHGFSQRISEPLKILSRPFSEFLCRNERLPQTSLSVFITVHQWLNRMVTELFNRIALSQPACVKPCADALTF